MQPRIYTYKITFEEVPYYYYGSKKEKVFNEEYWGSPVTNKWCWELYTPKKQILEFFEFGDEGYIKAQEVEKRLIRPVYNTDKWCLNMHCGGNISLDISRKVGRENKELKRGYFSVSPEEQRINQQKNGRKGGAISGKRQYELGIGLHGKSKEERRLYASKAGKVGANIKWMCTETGYISNAGGLTCYQTKRGIDMSKRIKLGLIST